MHRARRNAVLAVSAAGFVYDCEQSLKDEGVNWTEAYTGRTAKASIFVNDKQCRITSGHDIGQTPYTLKVTPPDPFISIALVFFSKQKRVYSYFELVLTAI